MGDSKHEHLRRLFDRALELPAASRVEFLERECAGDAALRQRLHNMLAAAEDEHFLSAPTGTGQVSAAAEPLHESPGTRIGPYKLLQLIGEGGFGTVFMAEQEKPVARKVALKIIKLGMDTRQVVARFEQERQALSMMDHPNIARVLDAGATDTGRPYFVMDLVKGAPIAEYCDKNNLTIDERLELFAQVCSAVQHAHTKGIIHRDLKPSNILVGTQDGRPQAKVIDFGIAKATSSRLTDKTLFTEHHQVIGTLQYMSPEQAEGSLDIDTRTDVYSLGVLLYELLTGSTPFDRKTVKDALYGEIQRMIREVEPPKPSTRLSDSQDTLASIAAHRRVEPKRLGSIVRGELDWIVMKALEKDRQRRYETANGLALDIRRYLGGEAVIAAPPSATYRFQKFMRRNRGAVAAVGAVAAALLIGVVGFAWQANVARRERDNAVKAQTAEAEQRRVADVQRDRALAAEGDTRKRADELKLVSDFQADMLAQVDATEAGKRLTADVQAKFEAALTKSGVPDAERVRQVEEFATQWQRVNTTDAARDLIDRTILRPAVAAIEKQFKDQPVVEAQLRQVLADRYRELGLYDAALPLQQQALATRRRVLGEENPDTLRSINSLGNLLQDQSKLNEAEACFREALEKRRRVLGEEHPDTMCSMNNLGSLLQELGKWDEAERILRQVMETSRRVLGEENPDTLCTINNLGMLLQQQDKLGEAERYYREALEKRRRVQGDDHRDTLSSINNLGLLLRAQGRLGEAEPLFREALERCRRLLGEKHQYTLISINNLGSLLQAEGKLSEAEPLLREALEKFRRVLGEEHVNTLISITNLGILLQEEGKLGEAEPYLREVLEKFRRVLGGTHRNTLNSINSLGMLLLAQGKLNEAEPYLREGLETRRHVLGDDHSDTLNSINNVGLLLLAQGKHADAAHLLTPAEPAFRKMWTGANLWKLASFLMNLGKARTGIGEFTVAEDNLLEAHSIFVKSFSPTDEGTREFTQAIVDLYTAWHAAEPGKAHDVKSTEWKAKLDAIKPSATAPVPEKKS